MTDSHELDAVLAPEERTEVVRLAKRLEQERALPAPGFRGELRRRRLYPS